MVSTYKGVFLYALSDIEHYNDRALLGKEWLEISNDQLIVRLDFIVARMLKYYWEISKLDIRHTPRKMCNDAIPSQDINIVEEIKKEMAKTKQIPTLKRLCSDNSEELRNRIIRSSTNEVLKNILNDFPDIYEKRTKKNIQIDNCFIEFLQSHGNEIRNQLQIKLKTHLEGINPHKCFYDQFVDNNNPFYLYVIDNSLSETEVNKIFRNIIQMIKSSSGGIYKSDIIKMLKISPNIVELIESKLVKIDGITKKEIIYQDSLLDILFEYKTEIDLNVKMTKNRKTFLDNSVEVTEYISKLYGRLKDQILKICPNIKIIQLKTYITFEIYGELLVKLLFRKSKITCTFKKHIAELTDSEHLLEDISKTNTSGNDQTRIDICDEKTFSYCVEIIKQCYILQTDF